MLSLDWEDEGASTGKLSSLEKRVKELENDLFEKVAPVEVARHDLGEAHDSVNCPDAKVQFLTR